VERAKNINPSVTILAEAADISQVGTADRLVNLVVETFGRLDYACNVAGVPSYGAQRE